MIYLIRSHRLPVTSLPFLYSLIISTFHIIRATESVVKQAIHKRDDTSAVVDEVAVHSAQHRMTLSAPGISALGNGSYGTMTSAVETAAGPVSCADQVTVVRLSIRPRCGHMLLQR
jgi:hypothetical protein